MTISISPAKTSTGSGPSAAALDQAIGEATAALKRRQREDGHWVYDLEADATIPAEYIMLNHFLDEIEDSVEAELADYLRAIQGENGGWPLFHGGDVDISATVKAYYALKLVGDDPEAPHMHRARDAILAGGGAERTNVFTRYALALFGQVPWRAVPVMPVELAIAPRWFPITLYRMSYWSRTVVAPLLILAALKPVAKNPRGVTIRELFRRSPEQIRDWHRNPTGHPIGTFFLLLDKVLRVIEPRVPSFIRKRAINKAVAFFRERLNGEDGLGAIFPAMANAVMAMEVLGYPKDHADLVVAKLAVKKLLTKGEGKTFCQPCVSPIWDTGLAAHALMESGESIDAPMVRDSCEWLKQRQVLDVVGDWAEKRPGLRPGGWAFQYNNAHYPDVDDTAVVAMALHRADGKTYQEPVARAVEWVIGMQSSDGGWGAFDIDNNSSYLNHMPFADHGALLDPSTADVSARCLSFLAQTGHERTHPTVVRGIEYLKREQEADGSWFGRWGTNYIYGAWSVLCALNAAGEDMGQAYIRKSVDWLLACQRDDGGWGEDGATYWNERRGEVKESTPSQTAWAVLGLMAAGEVDHPAVKRGIDFLLAAPREADGRWREPWFTAVGFPRVFYLRYHSYAAVFPLWALARYRNLRASNTKAVRYGM
ncbi:MAG: squalene--hopene cyclase [Rhodospirillaceae bacterium]|nr:MAG: squalene--hopene cyclase [Rhodospirillaceae bacterium]